MKLSGKFWLGAMGLALALGLCAPAKAQTQSSSDHVVTLDELKQDEARPAQARAENEAAVRKLLQSEPGQEALRNAKVDYTRVDKAIGQLDDSDLAKVAERSRQAEADFAARGLTATLIIVIVCIIVLIVVLTLVF